MKRRSAPVQDTPRALMRKNQISQAQCRAKRGAALAVSEGEYCRRNRRSLPAGAKTQTTTAGTGDINLLLRTRRTQRAMAVTGVSARKGSQGLAAQQGILPPPQPVMMRRPAGTRGAGAAMPCHLSAEEQQAAQDGPERELHD